MDWLEHVSDDEYETGCALCDRKNGHGDGDGLASVSSALAKYQRTAVSDLWKRPQLAKRERSLVTLSVLIARVDLILMVLQAPQMVRPSER